jgi:hypothetical protein
MKDGFIADLIQVCATMDMRALRIIDGFDSRLVRKHVATLEREGGRSRGAAGGGGYPAAEAGSRFLGDWRGAT